MKMPRKSIANAGQRLCQYYTETCAFLFLGVVAVHRGPGQKRLLPVVLTKITRFREICHRGGLHLGAGAELSGVEPVPGGVLASPAAAFGVVHVAGHGVESRPC